MPKISIANILVIIPFILVYLGEIFNFTNPPIGTFLKVLSIAYMFTYSFLRIRSNRLLLESSLVFIVLLMYHILISYNIYAGIESGIRYLFPIAVLTYGYSIRKYYMLLIHFFILYVVINNFYQIYIYINWLRDIPQWFYFTVPNTDITYYNSTLGVIRATGIMGFFAVYGFMNLVSYFIVKEFIHNKYRNMLLWISIIGLFASLSFKAIGVFLLLLFIVSKRKVVLVTASIFFSFLMIAIFPKKANEVYVQISYRILTYITEGNSARGDSYRVMIEDILNGRILGRGSGSFGGAASTKYKSPVYSEMNFNWYGLKLATTDTYYPHVFVELGFFTAIFYLFIVLIPILRRKFKLNIFILLFVIYFSLFFDSLFSFAMNNLGYLMVSLVFVYPILEYSKVQEILISEKGE